MARDLAPHGVRVCAVAPGDIDTAKSRQVAAAEPGGGDKQTPLGQGQPEDVAAAVVFFASPAAGFITGQLLLVDGGTSAH